MNAFDAMQAVLHTDPNLSEAAIYTPGGMGPSFPVRVVRDSGEDRGNTEAVTVQAPAVDGGPRSGDRIEIGCEGYRVESVERTDAFTFRLVLSCL